jgi:hypothetical protein
MPTAPLAPRRPATALLRACLCVAAATALAARPADAQWGKIKDLGKAAAKGAVEGAVGDQAKKAVGGDAAAADAAQKAAGAEAAPMRARNVAFTDDVIEITEQRIAQLLRGLDAETAARPQVEKAFLAKVAQAEASDRTFAAREASWKKEYAGWERRRDDHDRCTKAVEAKYTPEAERLGAESEAAGKRMEKAANATFTEERTKQLKEMAERAQAANKRGDQATAMAIGDSLRVAMQQVMQIASMGQDVNARSVALGRASEAELKRCGDPGPAPKSPERAGQPDVEEARRAVKLAGVKAAGIEERQYDVLRERVEAYARMNGRGRAPGAGFTAGELQALAKALDTLRGRSELMSDETWDPYAKAAKGS